MLKKLSEAKSHFESHCQEYCTCVTECLRTRLLWSDLQLFRDIVFMLGSQGWQKIVDEQLDMSHNAEGTQQTESEDPLDAIDRLVERFRFPLERASAEVLEESREFETMIQYAGQFISLSTLDYQAVWWRLFHAPNASEWSNVLCLVSLLFSLPVSNGKVERAFSQVNLLKSSKRTTLGKETLNDLLVLNTDKFHCISFHLKLSLTSGGMLSHEKQVMDHESTTKSVLQEHQQLKPQTLKAARRRRRRKKRLSIC